MNPVVIVLCAALMHPTSRYRVDHILIGVADLDRGMVELKKATGVAPVYGGKHPRGTHNALISLGNHTYLELIAFQPGVTSVPGMTDLTRMQKPTPTGWAVSGTDIATARNDLHRAGFETGAASAGSRITPAGVTLRWQATDLVKPPAGAPFFIEWAAGTPHPSTTSPAGCKLVSFEVVSPAAQSLDRLVAALGLNVHVRSGTAESYELLLDCPAGRVSFGGHAK